MTEVELNERLTQVELSRISLNPYQPRKKFSLEELQELAGSIQTIGLIHPPVVREVEGGFEIISGERRFRAAKLAGLTKIPVIIRSSTGLQSAHAALVENVQRVDLTPIEIAKSLKLLSDKFDLSQEELSQKIGKKRSTVANYIRLLALPDEVQQAITDKLISMGHAKALLSLQGKEKQKSVFYQILKKNLSVRQTEKIVATLSTTSKALSALSTKRSQDVHLDQIAEKIQQKFGTKVVISGSGAKGKISIDYYNLDDLDRILELMGITLL